MRVRYKGFELNRSEIARMAVGPEVHRVCREVAQQAKGYAENIAPRSKESKNKDHEHYADQFVLIDVLVTDVGDPVMNRRGVHLANLSPKAKLIEVGAARPNAAEKNGYRVFARTAEWLSGLRRWRPRAGRASGRRRYR